MNVKETPFKKTVAVDFDGVLHVYKSKWTCPEEIHDGPTPGAKKWVEDMLAADIDVVVYSARAQDELGAVAIRTWLKKHGFPCLPVTGGKPSAQLYVDDRAFQFNGDNWPSARCVKSYQPWNRGIFDANAAKRNRERHVTFLRQEYEASGDEEYLDELLETLEELGL